MPYTFRFGRKNKKSSERILDNTQSKGVLFILDFKKKNVQFFKKIKILI